MKRVFAIVLIIVLALSTLYTSADGTWTCPNCGRNSSGMFCGGCGTPKPEETWTCPNCGREGNTDKFCPSCATPRPIPVDPNAWNGFLEGVHYNLEDNVLYLIEGCKQEYLEQYFEGLTEALKLLNGGEAPEICVYGQEQVAEDSFSNFISKLSGRAALSEASFTGLLDMRIEEDQNTFKDKIELAILKNELPLYICTVAPLKEEIEEPEKPAYTLNTVKAANVRSGPGFSFNILGSINPKQTVNAYELVASSDFSGNWYRIDYKGQTGYISESTVNSKGQPTYQPQTMPTVKPTAAPTVKPTTAPTTNPTTAPTVKPTAVPTVEPTVAPTTNPVQIAYYRYRDTTEGYSEWSAWGDWTYNRESTSDLKEEQSRTIHVFYRFKCNKCGQANGYKGQYHNCKNCGQPLLDVTYSEHVTDSDYGIKYKYPKQFSDGWYFYGGTKSQYSYRTRTIVPVTSDWSSWSTVKPESKPGREIQTEYR